jgi:tetratricopeptide (TPR) repeat protein
METLINLITADRLMRKGNTYIESGDIGKAIAVYNQAIRTNPQYAKAYFVRAKAYLQLEDY